MDLRAGPARERFHVGLEHDVEIIEIARAALHAARRVADHLAGIGELEQQRPVRLVDLAGRVGMAVRQVAVRVRRGCCGRGVARRGEHQGAEQRQKLTRKARRMRSSQSDGASAPA